MASTILLGSTGAVGSKILTTLFALPAIGTITAIARREPKATDAKLKPIVDADTTKWAPALSSVSPTPSIYFSGLATTKAAAGGFDKQYAIDYDLNLELAQAAHKAGIKTYVLISVTGSDANSYFAYTKMKGKLEEEVKKLGFETTIFVKPAIITGEAREEFRFGEAVVRGIAGFLPGFLRDRAAQDDVVIARAAVAAALIADKGEAPAKVWDLGPADIIKYGRTEWKL